MNSSTRVSDAYAVLGLQEGSSFELVKTTYKQAALRTHPDKNPDNPAATEEFQRLGEAYRLLVKHLDPSARPSSTPSFSGFPEYGHFGFDGYYSEDDDLDDFAHDYEDSDDDDNLAFYLYLFQRMMEGRNEYYRRSRHTHRRRAHPNPPQRQVRRETAQYQETTAQYEERMRRSREEQITAEQRRQQESAARKERAAQERERERLEAEQRQKDKVQAKKTQADAVRKSAEARAKEIRRSAQEARSLVFKAARNGDVDNVKRGIWENAVDPAGAEIKPGYSDLVEVKPDDPLETLLHIATTNDDLELVKWLDSHSAEPEERNSAELTAFQLALKLGRLSIVKFFLDTYPPDLPESKGIYHCHASFNLVDLALESRDPEHVWVVLEHKLATPHEIHRAATWAASDKGFQVLKGKQPSPVVLEKAENIVKLLNRYDTMSNSNNAHSTSANVNHSPAACQTQTAGPKSHAAAGIPPQNIQTQSRGRGRGYGRGRGKGRGRGSHSVPSL